MSEQLEEPFADVVEFLFFVVAVAEKAAGDVLDDRFEELFWPVGDAWLAVLAS